MRPGSARLGPLTVDEPDSRHGDGEEAILLHVHFDQHSSEDEEQQDEDEAACDSYRLRYSESTNAHVSPSAKHRHQPDSRPVFYCPLLCAVRDFWVK